MSETHQNTIEIGCTPEQLYRYLTQPWRWHEWHPSSRGAKASVEVLQVGDEFEEQIELRPFSPLPLRMRRSTRYRVVSAVPAAHWKVEGLVSDGWIQIEYGFSASPGGTHFTRTLSYSARGASRLLMPFLRPRMKRITQQALDALKQRMEAQPDIGTAPTLSGG